MKKIVTYILSVVCILSGVVLFSGCAKDSYTYINADEYLSGNATISDGEVTEIDLDYLAGSVEVEISSEVDEFTIEESYKKDLSEDERVHFLFKNGKLMVKYRASSSKKVKLNLEKTLVIKIPADRQNLTKITSDTHSASVKIKGNFLNGAVANTISEVSLVSESGGIVVGGLNISELKVTSTSGNVDIKTCNVSKSVSIETISGGVYSAGIITPVINAKSTSGAMRFKLSTTGTVNAETTSGAVEVGFLSSISGFTIGFETRSGKYSTEFSETADGSNRKYGSGSGANVTVKTVSGALSVKKYEE